MININSSSLSQAMDGEMYSRAREAYVVYAQIEMDSAKVARAEFEDLREQASLVSFLITFTCTLHSSPAP